MISNRSYGRVGRLQNAKEEITVADEFFDRHLGRSVPRTDDGAAHPPGAGPGIDYDKMKAAAIANTPAPWDTNNAWYQRSLKPGLEPQASSDAQKAQAELNARPDPLMRQWEESERLRDWLSFFRHHAGDPLVRELANRALCGGKAP